MFITSRWLSPGLALSVTVLHIGLLASDYLAIAANEMNFDIAEYVRRDLDRPFFEPSGFCGAYTHYSGAQSAAVAINFPAYLGAMLLHYAVNRSETCIDSLMPPRGQILTAGFVPPLWFIVGLTMRRFGQRRWRRVAIGRFTKAVISLGLLPLPLGILFLLFGFLGLLFEHSLFGQALGFAFWMLFIPTLSAERLRLWPFNSLQASPLIGPTEAASSVESTCE